MQCVLDYVPSNITSVLLWLFFFFQAEDGIRDVAVTGVQTCALPICHRDAVLLRCGGGILPGAGVPSRGRGRGRGRDLRPGDCPARRRATVARRARRAVCSVAGAGGAAHAAAPPGNPDGSRHRRAPPNGVAQRDHLPGHAAAYRAAVPDRGRRAAARADRRRRSGRDPVLRFHHWELRRADHRLGGEPAAPVRHHGPGAAAARVEPVPRREPPAPGRVLPSDPGRVPTAPARARAHAPRGTHLVRGGDGSAALLEALFRLDRADDPPAGARAHQTAGRGIESGARAMRMGLFTLWSIAAAGGCQIEKRPPAPPADSTAAVPAAPAAPATPPPPPPAPAATKIMAVEGVRSEERRVGEEGRSRWSPYH